LIWAAKSPETRHLFNYAALKSLNDELQMRSDWVFPLCTGPERLKRDGRKLHPTQKPEALLHRILVAASKPGQVVLDPFFGTGTTGAVARRLRRRFVGIERDGDYAAAARARIAAVEPAAEEAVTVTAGRREAARVPFGNLIERGLIAPGETLVDPGRRYAARVRADGSVIADLAKGSIHQVAAAVQHLPACNGWTFWCVVRQGKLVSIDLLRQQAREQMAG
jgi:modification methylase